MPPDVPPASPADPTTPGGTSRPTALGAAVASGAIGIPSGFLAVWLLETYGTAHGQPLKLDATTASLLGSSLSSIGGYAWLVLQGLMSHWISLPKS